MKDLNKHITEAVSATWATFGRRWWNELDAEDAKQQAFMSCWERKDLYDPERSSPSTFFSMVSRQAITVMRQKNSKIRETVSLSAETFEDGPSAADCIPAKEEASVVEFRDEFQLVMGAVNTPGLLTQAERKTLESVASGVSSAELAGIQGVSPQAVSKRLHRGLSKLRSALSKAQ